MVRSNPPATALLHVVFSASDVLNGVELPRVEIVHGGKEHCSRQADALISTQPDALQTPNWPPAPASVTRPTPHVMLHVAKSMELGLVSEPV